MRRVFALAVSAVMISACTNLQAVSTASGQLLTASSSWNTVADDLSASCQRRNQVSLVPSECANEKKATQGLEAADKALDDYFTALQQAADTKNFNLDAADASLAASVGAIPGINTAQVSAVKTFGTFLSDMATAALREKTLDALIRNGAPKAKDVITVLQQVGVPALTSVYRSELRETTSSFVTYIQSSGVAFDPNKTDCLIGPNVRDFSTGNSFLLATEYCRRVRDLTAKQTALANYNRSLDSAQKTLQELADGKDKLKDADVIKALLKDASTLRDDVNTMKKAFG